MQQVVDALIPLIIFVVVVWGVSQIIMMLIPGKKDRQRKQRARQLKNAQRAEDDRKASLRIERDKMSDELRYDVMHRDGFRCVRCGATAQDGVKLHVDHIVPVSKGGKTEMSNLQTLCERCNLGKGNRYSE